MLKGIIRRRNGKSKVLTVICEMMMDSEKRLVCALQTEPNDWEKGKKISFILLHLPLLSLSTYRANQSYGMIGVHVFPHQVAPILNCIVRDSHNYQIILWAALHSGRRRGRSDLIRDP